METPQTYNDVEIDLRKVVLTLWRGRWVIIALTLVAAVAAFALSKWVLPERYQAIAHVTITKPILVFQDAVDTGGITIGASLPDLVSVVELSTTQSLLEKVTASPEIANSWDDDTESLISMVEAFIVGWDQVRLQVSDKDPVRAADLTNAWAERVAEQINMLYGVDAIAQDLDAQVVHALDKYSDAQAALEDELSKSQVVALGKHLNSTANDLTCVLSRNSAAARIIEDLQIFEQGLRAQSGNASLTLGDALALTTLQQRTSASQICASGTQNPQLQFGTDTLFDIPVAQAFTTIAQMKVALQTQQPLLGEEQARLEEEIPSLKRDLENAQYQVTQLTQARDQAQALHAALLQQQGRINIILMTSAKIATISSPAVTPEKKSSPNTVMNTALGGIMGLILGVFWIFVAGWWREGDVEQKNKKDPKSNHHVYDSEYVGSKE